MSSFRLTRREFVASVGAVVGSTLVQYRPAEAAPPSGARSVPLPVRLDSNENPYGPSRRALEAMDGARAIAARYPDDLEDRMTEALSKPHGVLPGRGILGGGS